MNSMNSPYFTLKDIESYLRFHHDLDNPQDLFVLKETDPERYIEIVDNTFYKFTHHKLDIQSGELIAEDPKNPLFRFYVFGYPGYHTIEDLQDLAHHMLNAVMLREEKLRDIKQSIEKEGFELG